MKNYFRLMFGRFDVMNNKDWQDFNKYAHYTAAFAILAWFVAFCATVASFVV